MLVVEVTWVLQKFIMNLPTGPIFFIDNGVWSFAEIMF
jgi:hypothetical protein